jgi:hypothetical protein
MKSESVCERCRPGFYYKDGLCPESEFSSVEVVKMIVMGVFGLMCLI